MQAKERLAFALVTAIALILAIALLIAVVEHGSDLLFSDQWMIYAPFFRGEGVGDAFMLQHGPHRQGAGAVVTWAGLRLSGWDARADSIAIIGITLLSCGVALLLKRRLFGSLDAADVAIAAIVVNLVQIEAVVLVPNPAHGALPLLLLLLACLAICDPRLRRAALWLSVLSPLLLFTGFGLVAAPVLALLFALDAIVRRGDARALLARLVPLAAIASAAALFFRDYRVEPRTPASLVEIARFAALMPARFGSLELGRFGGAAVVAGSVMLLALAGVAVTKLVRLLRDPDDTRSRVIFVLASFTLAFVPLASVGRAFQGAQFGQSSRYMPLIVPGMLALYFAARACERGPAKVALATLVALLAVGAVLPVPLQLDQSTPGFSIARRDWRDCYLATRDARVCSERTQLQIWSGPYEADVQAKLDYLERNRLGPFRERD